MPHVALIDPTEDEEILQLQRQIQEAEEKAAELALRIADVKREIRGFQAEYSARIGPLYIELDEIELQIREYQLRTELIRGGVAPNSPAMQRRLEEAFQAERQRLHAYQETVRESEPMEEKPPPDRDLRKLYLQLAKRYHPDKAPTPEERERNERMMALINQAYEEGDRVTLERLASQDEPSPTPPSSVAETRRRLQEQLQRLKRSVMELQKELEKHQQSDVYLLKQQVEAARERGEDLLGRLARDIQYKIAAARRRLNVVKNLFERWANFLRGRSYVP